MNLAKLLVAIGATTTGFHRGLAGVKTSVGKLEGRLGGLRKGFARAGDAMVSMGKQAVKLATVGLVALTLALGGAVTASINYEDAFAGVRKTVEATEPELAQLSRDFRQLATEIPIAATELAGLGETAGALGVPTKNIAEFVRVTALLGVTTNISSAEAADSLGRLSNILGLTSDDYGRFASSLVALGNAGASTEAEIIEIAKRMGSAGKVAGLSTPQIIGWGSAVASVSGMEPERAGTSMQSFLLGVTKMASKAGPELNLLAKTAGLGAAKFRKLFAKDANAALLKFIAGLGKLKKAQKLATLEALGFNDSGVTRALLGMAGASGEVARQLDVANESWLDNTALTEEAERKFATTRSQLELLKNNLLEIAMTIGDAVLPLLTPLIAGFKDWIAANRDLIAQVAERLVTGIRTVVGAISQWINENQPLIAQVRTFATGALKTLWTVLTTQVIPALFGSGGKGGIIPGLVELGRQIFEYVVPKVEEFITTLTKPGGVIESVSKVAGPIITSLLDSFGKIVLALFGGGKTRGLVPAIGDLVAVLWDDGKGPLAKAVAGIGGLFAWLGEQIAPLVDLLTGFTDLLAASARKWKELEALVGRGEQGVNFNPFWMLPLPTLPFANGGVAPAGQPALIGERGPEVGIPGRNTAIVPNRVLEALGGHGDQRGGDTIVQVEGLLRAETPDDVGRTLRRYASLGLIGAPMRAGV